MRTKICRALWLLLALPLLLAGVATAAGLLVADGGFGGVPKGNHGLLVCSPGVTRSRLGPACNRPSAVVRHERYDRNWHMAHSK